jgi:hypothetical protein
MCGSKCAGVGVMLEWLFLPDLPFDLAPVIRDDNGARDPPESTTATVTTTVDAAQTFSYRCGLCGRMGARGQRGAVRDLCRVLVGWSVAEACDVGQGRREGSEGCARGCRVWRISRNGWKMEGIGVRGCRQ